MGRIGNTEWLWVSHNWNRVKDNFSCISLNIRIQEQELTLFDLSDSLGSSSGFLNVTDIISTTAQFTVPKVAMLKLLLPVIFMT